MLLKPPIEKNALKRLPSKPNPYDALGKSESQLAVLKEEAAVQYSRLQGDGVTTNLLQQFNNTYLFLIAPKTTIKYHHITNEKNKRKKLNRLRWQYKFISRLQKNKIKKLRSKTLPLAPFIRIRHTRAKTVAEEQHDGPILNLEESLKRKIDILVKQRKSAMRRHIIKLNYLYIHVSKCQKRAYQFQKKNQQITKNRFLNIQSKNNQSQKIHLNFLQLWIKFEHIKKEQTSLIGNNHQKYPKKIRRVLYQK